mmetsp:Transcript_6361/g.8844  ORF Transcript_6361/g.8844 Transcript_6361/m.8844 type:complete len:214 (+) Transcript_6361:79-720(+)
MLSDSAELQRVKQVAVITSVVLSSIGQILIWCTKPAFGVEFSHVLVPLLWGFPTLLTVLSCFKSHTTHFYSAFPLSGHIFNSIWMFVMVYQITYSKEYCNDDFDETSCEDYNKLAAGSYLLFMLQLVCVIIAGLEVRRAFKLLKYGSQQITAPADLPPAHVVYFEPPPPMGNSASVPPMPHYMVQPMPGQVVFMAPPQAPAYPPQVPLEEIPL